MTYIIHFVKHFEYLVLVSVILIISLIIDIMYECFVKLNEIIMIYKILIVFSFLRFLLAVPGLFA